MKTVHEVSRLTGLSVRTLQYYDRIGLLTPSRRTEAGYRLYGDSELMMIQQIMLFRELEFPLAEIKKIISSPAFDRSRAIDQQIELLTMKKARLEDLISYAKRIRSEGGGIMDFSVFDTKKMDEYAEEAKKTWGSTAEYREYEEKSGSWKDSDRKALTKGLMSVFAGFGAIKDGDPSSEAAKKQVRKLQSFITEHFYTCSDEILVSLAGMYDAGGDMTENIDNAGGAGTAAFAAAAIRLCCGKQTSFSQD